METAFLADSSPWNQTYTRDKERNPERHETCRSEHEPRDALTFSASFGVYLSKKTDHEKVLLQSKSTRRVIRYETRQPGNQQLA